jgi:NADH:ubiquinone oxidoreductase subunit 6 (subunit J)
MKYLSYTLKILLSVFLWYILFSADVSFAAVVNIPGNAEIKNVSIDYTGGWDAIYALNSTGFRILTMIKVFIQGLLIIMVVYTGFMMIYSMGNDEETLSSAKRQIWYFLVALLFINIPWTLYEAFYKNGNTTVGGSIENSWFTGNSESNLFVDFFVFGNTLNDNIVGFMQIMIFIAAIFMLVLEWILMITSRGREEKLTEAKNKILYIILALIFVGMIEVWKRLAFSWNITDGVNLFESLANLALFFAGPVALFFLTLAGYYYITSNGDEERIAKAKSIIINTILATLILLASYTFLLDLGTL